MKKKSILFTLFIFTILAVLITSCGPGRGYYSKTPAPRYRTSFSLIISPTPGFTMSRYPDGRYYHRSAQGYMYWQGYDNRFYLDKKYIGRVHYDQQEYNEWKRNNNNGNKRQRRYR
ncbi:MAG TPA: hypothetical protein VIV35_08165 [Chitinophagaceae bacterium]